MDVDDEWELLSDDGFLEITDDGGGNQIYRRNNSSPAAVAAAAVLHANYFICPSSPPPLFLRTTAANDQPIQINIESFRKDEGGADQDPISQVFFKKQAEFVDMKVESPKPAKFEPNFQFEDKDMAIEEKEKDDSDDEDDDVWKRRLGGIGIGAICSFGVAAATFCIVVFTNNHNHKLQLRIYTDDKVRQSYIDR